MQEVAAVRQAALDAVGDIEPAGLHERIRDQLEGGSMVPGVLTTLSVRALTDAPARTEEDVTLLDPVSKRGAGVQLIYDGLYLTRELAHDEVWADSDDESNELAILAADVLVARGFYLLARTEAADAAVETVRAFGRDQTVRNETEDPSLNKNLEIDVIELAIVAGATHSESATPQRAGEFATEMGDTLDEAGGFPDADAFFVDSVIERLKTLGTDPTSGEGVTTSVDD